MPSPTDAPLTRGHKKKARTRRLLLDTAMEVLAADGEGFSAADIAARAGVSNGTFYNYFADKDELIAAVVPEIVGAFAAEAALEVDLADPAARFAHITARVLERAVEAPDLVRVLLRIEAAQQALVASEALAHLRADLAAGRRSGRFAGAIDDATVDVVVGTLLVATGRIVGGETRPAYRRAVIARLLRALGIDDTGAVALAKEAVDSRSLG